MRIAFACVEASSPKTTNSEAKVLKKSCCGHVVDMPR